MKRFQSPEYAQRLLSTFKSINAPFRMRLCGSLSTISQASASPLEQYCSRSSPSIVHHVCGYIFLFQPSAFRRYLDNALACPNG